LSYASRDRTEDCEEERPHWACMSSTK